MTKKTFTQQLKVFMTLCLLLVSIGNAWGGEETWTYDVIQTSPTFQAGTPITVNEATWSITMGDKVGSPSANGSPAKYSNIYGWKWGDSSSKYWKSYTLSTEYFKDKKVKSVTINVLNNGSKAGTMTVTQGSTTIGTASKTFGTVWTDLTANTTAGTSGTLSIQYTVAQASYIHSISVTYEEGGSSKTLESIAISGTPTKTTYEAGESFDVTGLTVTGTYDDESTADLTADAEWTFDPATFTSTTQNSVSVTATVDGKSDTKNYAVTVSEFVQTYANTYTSDASLSSVITGSKVKWEGCKVTDGYAALKIAKAGTATITVPAGTKTVHLHMVAWNGESADVAVKLGETALSSIKPTADAGVSGTSTTFTIATEPKTENSYYFPIEVNADEATTLSLTTASNKRAILFGVNFEEAKKLESIAVKTDPSKTTYTESEKFDPAGLVITATYDDESTEDIAYDGNESKFTFNPTLETALQTTDTKVTITYGEKTVDQAITVNEGQKYTVTFDAGTGTCSTTSLTETSVGSGVVLPEASFEGWIFAGWSDKKIETATTTKPSLFAAGTTHHPSGDKTLYAVYKNANELYYLSETVNSSTYYMKTDCSATTTKTDGGGFWWDKNKGYLMFDNNGTTTYISHQKIDKADLVTDKIEPTDHKWTITTNTEDQTIKFQSQANTSRYLGKTDGDFKAYANEHTLNYELVADVTYYSCPAPTAAAPTITPSTEADTYWDPITVTLASTTEGASIYYTTNGDVPTTASNLYENPISVSETTTIKAIAVKDGLENSKVVTKVFTFGPIFNSLEALVAADLTSGTTVKVSFENVPIKSIFITQQGNRNGIYFDIQKGGKDIEIFYQNVPEEWIGGGTVSGTLTCPWKEFNGTWELAPATDSWDWSELTYTAPTTYEININSCIGGTVTANPTSASAGAEITLTVTPDEGYKLGTLTVRDATEGDVTVTDNKFTMPASNVTVSATFVAKTVYEITWMSQGEQYGEKTQVTEGETLSLPTAPTAPTGYVFTGWVANEITEPTDEKPTFLEDGTVPTANATYYAVFATGTSREEIAVDFNGGGKDDLTKLNYVSANGLGGDYAESNAPYRVKLDNTGDYILLSLPNVPNSIEIDVKMLGGGTASSIDIQECATEDGEFTTVETMTISGSSNTVVNFTTEETYSQNFIKLLFNKGSNVGLGKLIAKIDVVDLTGYTTSPKTPFAITKGAIENGSVKIMSGEDEVTEALPNTEITLVAEPAEGYLFNEWKVFKTGDESTTVEVIDNKFTMPEYAVTVSATFRAKANYTITWMANGTQYGEPSIVKEGEALKLPATDPTAPTGYVFTGWLANEITEPTDTKPTFLEDGTIPTASATYYAVFAIKTTSEPTYTKCSTNDFDADAKYVLAAEESSSRTDLHYFSSYEGTTTDESWGKTSTTASEAIIFTLSGTASALVAQDASGNYLKALAIGNFRMSSSSTTLTYKDDGTIYNPTSTNYNLRYNHNGGSGGFRWYSTTTGTSAYFYKYDDGIKYSGYCTTVKYVTSIEIETSPAKVEYTEDESFDPTGLVITVTYSDESNENIEYAGNEGKFTFTPALETALQTTDTEVTVEYGGQTCKQNITVIPAPRYVVTIETPENGTLIVKNGETVVMDGDDFRSGTELTIEVSPNAGYKFKNWQAIDESTHTYTAKFKYTIVEHDVTIKANFVEKNVFTVTYNVFGKEIFTESVLEEESIKNAPTPTALKDWTFEGWTADEMYTTGNTGPGIYNVSTPITDNLSLYAVFKKSEGGEDGSAILTNEEIYGSEMTGSYSNGSITNDYGTWNYNACKQGNVGGDGEYFLQIRNNTPVSYLQIPTLPGEITSIVLNRVCNGSNAKYTGDLYFRTTADNDADAVATGTSSEALDNVTLTIPAGYKTGYIMSSDPCRISSVKVNYSNSTTTYTTEMPEGATVSVTVNPIGNGSFCSTVDLDFTGIAGVDAYIATSDQEDKLILNKRNKIPAGIGFFLIGTGGTYDIPVTSDECDDCTNNLLSGTIVPYTVKEADVDFVWALSKSDGKLHPVKAGVKIGAGKAYLNKNIKASALSLMIASEPTGIKERMDNGQWTDDHTPVFNLQGMRVTTPKKGEVYIMNGKKFLMK